METSLPLSSLVHCLFRCGTRMDRYTNHRGTQHAPMKDVAGLKRLQDDAVGMLRRFGAVHGLVEVRVKRLSQGVDALYAEFRDVVQQLLVDELETLAIIFVFRFAMRGESMLETVENRDESFDHASRGALRILKTLFFDALAVIRKIGLAAQHGLAQPFEVRRKFRPIRVGFGRVRVDDLRLGGLLEFGAIHFLVDILLDADVHFLPLFVTHRGTSPVLLNTEDRKSTRLNSSHVSISYAVFCLKKKKKKNNNIKYYYII